MILPCSRWCHNRSRAVRWLCLVRFQALLAARVVSLQRRSAGLRESLPAPLQLINAAELEQLRSGSMPFQEHVRRKSKQPRDRSVFFFCLSCFSGCKVQMILDALCNEGLLGVYLRIEGVITRGSTRNNDPAPQTVRTWYRDVSATRNQSAARLSWQQHHHTALRVLVLAGGACLIPGTWYATAVVPRRSPSPERLYVVDRELYHACSRPPTAL